MKRVVLTAGLVAALCLAGCAVAPERPEPQELAQLLEDSAFAAPTQPIDAAQVFALSPAMKRYLEVDIASQLRSMGRQRGLVDALYAKAQLRLDYETEYTRTASEAFEARSGNCLSLVLMSAAFAKHLDLPVHYQALIGDELWSRSGDLSIINGHVNIAIDKRLIDRIVGAETDTQLKLSFGALPAGRGALLREVSESTIVAMYMNNRAAETLVQGRLDDAYAYAREALQQEPRFASAYNTLGVIYTRRGLAAAAERAFRHTLARDADHRAAMLNLARLLERQGRSEEAAPWRVKLARLEATPPFQQFDLGRAAARAGDFRSARDHILREMRRDPDYHEFHFWLAIALYGLGEIEQARDHLTQAMRNSTTRREQSLYSAKLEALNSQAARAH